MLKEQLLNDLKDAMKEKNDIKKNTVQMVRAAILQVEKDKAIELDDNQIIDIIAKESKKRKDAAIVIPMFTLLKTRNAESREYV